MRRKILFLVLCIALVSLCEIFVAVADAGTKTFPAGSYIIPQDLCWQPNNDPKTVEICANGKDDDGDGVIDEANTVTNPYNCYNLTGCDPNKNDQGIFQSTGLIYEILDAGYPVYWIINPAKTDMIAVDFSITKSGTEPAVTIYNSPKHDSGTLSSVEYRGGPFVIDANDYDSTIQALFDKYKGATGTNGVKIHRANYDFSAEVDKVLSGKPPDVAVLGEGSVQVLTDYLFASGLGNNLAIVFKYVTTPQIIGGVLSNYQLLWAPHWEIDKEISTVADRNAVLTKIRSFLESGNAGFFECASIESLERAYDVSKNTTAPSQYYTGQGILLNKNYNYTQGRIQTNGGTMDYKKMVYEHHANVLAQCGGWRYDSTGGHVHNLRPHQGPNPDYVYNAFTERFIHDADSQAITGYAPKGYDYFIGGRINGSPTQGYVAYLAGHKYVKCTNTNTATPVQRFLNLEFNADLIQNQPVTVELVYSGCTVGISCPKASFNLKSMTGTYSSDGTMFVDLDSAEYSPDADPPTKYVLRNVIVGNKDPNNQKTMTGIIVAFPGNPVSTLLKDIIDVTDEAAPVTMCTPNAPTPASCPPQPYKIFDFRFSGNLAGSVVTVEAQYGTCISGTTCPKATYDVGTNTGTTGSDGTISIDLTGTSYNAATFELKNVRVNYLGTGSVTLDRFNVTFPGNGLKVLSWVNDVTTTTSQVCTSDMVSPAACPPTTPIAVPRTNSFKFKADVTSGTLTIEAIHAGCVQGSTCSKGIYNVTTNGKLSGQQDGQVKIDMSGATFDHAAFTLDNVIFTNITSNPTVTITKIYVSSSLVTKPKLTKVIVDGASVWVSNNGTSLDLTADINPDEVLTRQVQTLGSNFSGASPLDIVFGKAITECNIDWGGANTCGMKFVLNTLIGLQFQVIPNDYAKAGAIQQDNILYKGTFEFPGYKGHLYAYNVKKDPAEKLWDAGNKNTMPPAGTANPASPSKTNASRYIFTNLPGTKILKKFDVNNVGANQADTNGLWHYLFPTGSHSVGEVKALINSVRGRKDASASLPAGTGEVSKRLGGIEHSAPAIMVKSKLAGSPTRDRIVFVGGHDGMLHAFYAGSWDTTLNGGKGGYPEGNAGTGKEIWAYIPSTLLASLQNQTFTDCSPGEVLSGCTVGDCTCPTFPVAVSVDGSPALGDFFVDADNNPSTPKEWRTILVGTAKVMLPGDATQSVNQGIIFALDVTDPYNPSLLWERTYTSLIDTTVAPGSNIYRNYYPSSAFPSTYITTENTSFDPNMGDAKGVSIGRVQVGTTLDTYVFVTSRWVRQVNTGTVSSPHNVWGLSVFALDFYSGDIKWETKLIYTGDAEGVNEPPATPALLDYGNNGTYDYVVLGDFQGRLWVLKTVDGKNLTGDGPAFDVGKGAKEPIGVGPAIYDNKIVFGTGGRDSLQDETTTKYHVFAIEITSKGEVKTLWDPPFELQEGEKVWSSPVIDVPNNTVYVGTAKGYTDVGRPDMVTSSSGRLLLIDLAQGNIKKDTSGNDLAVTLDAAVIGDIGVENAHITVQTFGGKTYQFGAESEASFDVTTSRPNPIKTLWWRVL